MRLAIAAAALAAISGLSIWYAGETDAAEGDRWAVDRQNVNVRSGPSTSTDVLMTINPGERIIEIAAKGEWFFVEFPDYDKRGWVFGPLLTTPEAAAAAAPKTPQPAPEVQPEVAAVTETPEVVPQPAPSSTTAPVPEAVSDDEPPAGTEAATQTAALSVDEEPAAVKSFRETVVELNDRAVSVAGISLFSDVRSTGGGGVQVVATDTWATVPEAGQTSYMNALFDRWQSVANGLGPLSLQIVDPSGKVMKEHKDS